MPKPLKFQEMLDFVRQDLDQVPEHRTGRNTQYTITDAGLSAFSAFYMQSPSFLAYQRLMQQEQGRNNARSLFGIEAIPSDGQIRNLLDPVAPYHMRETYWAIYEQLLDRGHLEEYHCLMGTLLCSMDGTQYFGSHTVHCANCSTQEREEETYYSHTMLAAVLVKPGKGEVLVLEPEFIIPQDGHEKQDCEQQAIKRWIEGHAQRFAPWQVTILTDDLHSHQPLCELLLAHKFHFLMTCKSESHQALYQEVELLGRLEGAIHTMTVKRWNGRYRERWEYRWVEQVPLRAGAQALRVNWCEVTIIREDTGKRLYHNAWITDHELTAQTVPEIVTAGRAHWKVENEGFNVLKNQGYNLEHNYGHGQQYLSSVLVSLLLLAFLFHTVLQLSCPLYQAIRRTLGARRTFFNDLRVLTRYLFFSSWDQLLHFMEQHLELAPG